MSAFCNNCGTLIVLGALIAAFVNVRRAQAQ
jgi:hypothetical protein